MKYLILFFVTGVSFGQVYFSTVRFSDNVAVDRMQHIWFEAQLNALREPPLDSLQPGVKAEYRVTLLRSTGHPVALRLEVQDDGSAMYIVKVTDGKGGTAPGKLFRDEKWVLSAAESSELVKLFHDSDFFRLPVSSDVSGADGARWLVEANEGGRYKVITRFMPGPGILMDIGKKFASIANSDFDIGK